MEYEIVWTEAALEGLKGIWERIDCDNPEAANRVVFEIHSRVNALRNFPRSGQAYQKARNLNVREVLSGSYRIFYRVTDSTQLIEIVLVWHASRSDPQVLKKRH